jgi:hypothetical protein
MPAPRPKRSAATWRSRPPTSTACSRWSPREGIALTVVGPEVPLVAGVVDRFRAAGLRIFGPTAAAAQLEGSKAYAKDFLPGTAFPTAFYSCITDVDCRARVRARKGAPIVIKADGLAAGKGVIVAMSLDEAEAAVRDMLIRQRLRRCRRARRDRGIPRWRGSQLHLDGRRQDRAADGDLAGPQARRRRRHRPEHRRHGRVLAGAGGHARGACAGDARGGEPDRAGHDRRRHAVHRLPLRRA